MALKISISGVRGITGETLTDGVVSDFSKAFAAYLKKGVVVIGRDSRPSGKKIKDVVISGLKNSGIDVIYLGICPTPTVQLMVKELKADGGIIVTASHNPEQWNGLKFVRRDGIFLNADEAGNLIKVYENKQFVSSKRPGKLKIHDAHLATHIKKVLECVDVSSIRKRKLKVALDSCNGAGSIVTVQLLKELGCEVIELNTDQDGVIFPHNPEPVPENLKSLCEKVRGSGADIGFAQDADADRLAIVTEKGEAPGEEYTLALAADHVLSKLKMPDQTVVTNLSSSMMIDTVAKEYGARVIRTKVGEVNVAEGMVKNKAVIGGEGNGGVMYPKIGYDRDSLIGIALILESLASSKNTISAAIDALPKYYIVKQKVDCSSRSEADFLIDKAKIKFYREKLDLTEGVKIIFDNSWVHVRASNTEPVVRIIAEAESKDRAMELINKVIS
jgi:phosphomannomutase